MNKYLIVIFGAVLGLVFNSLRENKLTSHWISKDTRVARALTLYPSVKTVENGKRIGLKEMLPLLQRRDVVFLDARSFLQYKSGHITGAVWFSRENFDIIYPALRERLKGMSQVVVYCSGGGCAEAEKTAEVLAKLGHENIRVFPEGWSAWDTAKLPAEGEP